MIIRDKQRIKQTGEIFTPRFLIEQMVAKIPIDAYQLDKKWIDPACGDGNFLVFLKQLFMEFFKEQIPNDSDREEHILENMLYGIDIMPDNVDACKDRLGIRHGGPGDNNIVCANTLQVKDFGELFKVKK